MGKTLVEQAAQWSIDAGYQRLAVISAIGTIPYYQNLHFNEGDLYQVRDLVTHPPTTSVRVVHRTDDLALDAGRGLMRILVVGCGGIGGVTTAKLHQVGADVTAVSRQGSFRRQVAENGLRPIENGREERVNARVVEHPEGIFDLMVLTTQPTDVEAAVKQYLPNLATSGQVLVFQNGLREERVAAAINHSHPVLGGVVSWGATHDGEGRVERTAQGRITLGALEPMSANTRTEMESVLNAIAPIQHTENLRGARWSKLILNSMVSALGTLHGTRLGPVVAFVSPDGWLFKSLLKA